MRNQFRSFQNDKVKLVKNDGTVIDEIPANVQPNIIFIHDAELPIEEGDKLVRILPNSLIESYEVIDRGYYSAFGGIGAHYQVKVRKETSLESKKTESIIQIFNLGDNSRVNSNSEDNSINLYLNDSNSIFDKINEAFDKIENIEEKISMKSLLDELRNECENQTETRGHKYKEFISLASAHIGILAPFIPELTKLFI